jgi:E3 ubiquitin-protein ligase RNF213
LCLVLLVGLAENSPDMPLKVLHYMLVDPPIAIVGLSNWALDSSKMNRAICLQRPEPTAEDIMFTGQNIVGVSARVAESSVPPRPVLAREHSGATRLQPWLMNLANAFHSIYSNQQNFFGQQSRDFIGMRDYYSLLKHIRELYNQGVQLTPSSLANAVSRNFGGRPDAMVRILELYHDSCFQTRTGFPSPPSSLGLILENLRSMSSRHLMILSTNDSALQLLFGCNVLTHNQSCVLVGSRFKEDLQELHVIQQINQVCCIPLDSSFYNYSKRF